MIPRRSSPMPGGAANATSTSTIAGVAYCGDVPSTIAALCPMFAFLAVCVVISTISITGGFDAHPLPSLSNSTTSTPSSSSSVSGQNEFATFLGWYLFLLACCIFPTACAYHKCRRSVSDVAEYDERRRGGSGEVSAESAARTMRSRTGQRPDITNCWTMRRIAIWDGTRSGSCSRIVENTPYCSWR